MDEDVIKEQPTYRLSWKATNQYSVELTESGLRQLANQIDCEQGAELDLDEIYSALDSGDWRANEALQEISHERNWVDHDDCDVYDLSKLDAAGERK